MHYLAERPDSVNGGLLDFPRSVDDLFQRFWGVRPVRAEIWKPAVDIVETPQSYVLRVEIPGIDPKDMDVTLTGDTLTLRGEKPLEPRLDGETWCLNERMTGSFERSFNLPTPVAPDGIEAEARNGILTIKVMKVREAQPQKVTIRTV